MRTNRLGKYFQKSINDLMFSNRASTLLSHAAEAAESLPPPLNLKTNSFTGSEEGSHAAAEFKPSGMVDEGDV